MSRTIELKKDGVLITTIQEGSPEFNAAHAALCRAKMRNHALFYRVAINPEVCLTLTQRGELGTWALRGAIKYRNQARAIEQAQK